VEKDGCDLRMIAVFTCSSCFNHSALLRLHLKGAYHAKKNTPIRAYIPAADITRARKFYEELIGLQPKGNR